MQNYFSCDVCVLHRTHTCRLKLCVLWFICVIIRNLCKNNWAQWCDRFNESVLIFGIIMEWLYVVLHGIQETRLSLPFLCVHLRFWQVVSVVLSCSSSISARSAGDVPLPSYRAAIVWEQTTLMANFIYQCDRRRRVIDDGAAVDLVRTRLISKLNFTSSDLWLMSIMNWFNLTGLMIHSRDDHPIKLKSSTPHPEYYYCYCICFWRLLTAQVVKNECKCLHSCSM